MSYTIKEILRAEVVPALGCTEPVAVALCTAASASLISKDQIDAIKIWIDPNIYKNGTAVFIPGTRNLRGLEIAGAIGAVGGNPQLGLEVLEPITGDIVARANRLVKEGKVNVTIVEGQKGIFIKSAVSSRGNIAECTIRDLHDNIVSLKLNDKDIFDSALLTRHAKAKQGKGDVQAIEVWLKERSLDHLIGLLKDLDEEDLAFLEEGVRCNLRLAEYGLNHGSGLGIGKALDHLVKHNLLKNDMITSARMLTAAASDARMAGVKLPAMSSAGSGNQGLTSTLPIWAVKDYIECDQRRIMESIGLSHIITAYVKAHTGRLSAVCGSSIAAGAGATAGVTYLFAGDTQHIAGAIMNLVEDLAGVICDGAKPGCSLKLATAAGTAVQAALFSLHGVHVQPTDGIIGTSTEKTIRNIGELSTQGMIETDRTILKIMLEKQFSNI